MMHQVSFWNRQRDGADMQTAKENLGVSVEFISGVTFTTAYQPHRKLVERRSLQSVLQKLSLMQSTKLKDLLYIYIRLYEVEVVFKARKFPLDGSGKE